MPMLAPVRISFPWIKNDLLMVLSTLSAIPAASAGSPISAVDQGKFIAAEPCYGIDFANARLQSPGNLLEQQIADWMPQGIVDVLELIKVEIENGKILVVATCPGDFALQFFDENSAIAQAGQKIVTGHVRNTVSHSLALGDVD